MKGSAISVNCVHTGVIRTNLGRYNNGVLGYVFKMTKLFGVSAEGRVRPVTLLAISSDVDGISRKYFNRGVEGFFNLVNRVRLTPYVKRVDDTSMSIVRTDRQESRETPRRQPQSPLAGLFAHAPL